MKKIVVLACVVLAACGQSASPQIEVQTKIVTPDVPPAMLHCMDGPVIPSNITLQSQEGKILVGFAIAWKDCSLHLAAVAQALAQTPDATTK